MHKSWFLQHIPRAVFQSRWTAKIQEHLSSLSTKASSKFPRLRPRQFLVNSVDRTYFTVAHHSSGCKSAPNFSIVRMFSLNGFLYFGLASSSRDLFLHTWPISIFPMFSRFLLAFGWAVCFVSSFLTVSILSFVTPIFCFRVNFLNYMLTWRKRWYFLLNFVVPGRWKRFSSKIKILVCGDNSWSVSCMAPKMSQPPGMPVKRRGSYFDSRLIIEMVMFRYIVEISFKVVLVPVSQIPFSNTTGLVSATLLFISFQLKNF